MGPIFETRDLVYLISGYHKHLVENARPLSVIDMTSSADVEEPVDEEGKKKLTIYFISEGKKKLTIYLFHFIKKIDNLFSFHFINHLASIFM